MFYKLKSLLMALSFCCQLHKVRKYSQFSLAKLRKIQEHKLRALLKHAYNNISYYRRLFDQAGIKPKDIRTIDALQKIPITSRKTFQSLPIEEVVAKDVNIAQCANLRTSGSTGRPLDVFVAARQILTRRLSWLRMYFENGRQIKDKVLVITTPHNFLGKQWFHPWLYRLKVLREKYISVHNETKNFLREIVRYKPDIICSYDSIIRDLALQIKKRSVKGINPRMVFVTGETLSNKDRKLIQTVFKAEVFDYYSCSECGLIAWECINHSGYHIDSDNVIVQLVKNGKPVSLGEEGEVVITSLNQYTMPFIRYRLGDISAFADYKCKCGNNFPLLRFIKGRINDYLILPNGNTISHYLLMSEMDKIRELTHYQIIQEETDKIEVKLFGNSFLHESLINKIKKLLREVIEADVDIEIKTCEDINEEAGYKRKVIVSKVKCSNTRIS